jgi:hypothetical protein
VPSGAIDFAQEGIAMNRKLGLAAFLLTAVPVHWAMAQQNETTSPATPTPAEQKAAAETRTIELANEKAALEIKALRAKGLSDIVPASATSGTTTAKDGAGKAEAAALAAAAVNGVADDIAREARMAAIASAAIEQADGPMACGDVTALNPQPLPPEEIPPVLLLSADTTLTFAHWEQFRFRACTVAEQQKKAIKAADDLLKTLPRPNRETGGAGFIPAAQAAIAIGAKMIQLLTPDWEIGNIPVTTSNRALMAAVARAYLTQEGQRGRVYWQGQVGKRGASRSIFEAIDKLSERHSAAEQRIELLKPHLTAAKKALDAIKEEGPDKEKAKKEFDKWNNPTTALSDARTAYEQLIKDLNGKEGEALLPINRVVDEAAAAELLGSGGLALSLGVESSAGGYYTRKVIWDVLVRRGPPFYVSGGAVVTYAAIRPLDQQVLAAGLFTCNADYVRLNRISATVNKSDPIGCGPVAATRVASAGGAGESGIAPAKGRRK